MNRLGAGVSFIFITALLYGIKYVCYAFTRLGSEYNYLINAFAIFTFICGLYYLLTTDKEKS